MPDISMCTGGHCPLRERCYRFKATPSPILQSYFLEPPMNPDGTCDYFWEAAKR